MLADSVVIIPMKVRLFFLSLVVAMGSVTAEEGGEQGDPKASVSALLLADQADRRIRLVNPMAEKEEKALIWCYPPENEAALQWSPTDAKRVTFKDELLILAAYHGRVQLVRYRDGLLVKDFPAYPSCHSAEILPDGTIATANSNDGKLRLHFTAERFTDYELPYAHGLAWDKKRRCLWALGDQLYSFDYRDQKLVPKEAFPLPMSPTGHDLFPLRKRDALLVSNNEALFIFDLGSEEFEKISALREIKSASEHADGTIWVSDPKNLEGMRDWQSNAVKQVRPSGNQRHFVIKGTRFYKARWWQDVPFSY